MRGLALALCCAAALRSQEAPPQPAPTQVQGEIAADAEWANLVLVTGDVTLQKGVHLRIRAGTTVQFAPQDALQGGWSPQKVEVHVHGLLTAEGSSTAPIRFLPQREADGAHPGAWHGIVLHGADDERQRTRLVNVEVRGAFAGLQIPRGSPMVEDSVFLSCGTGVEVGSAYRDGRFYGTRGGNAAPELRRCRFANCHAGVYAEGRATPEIQRCVFYRCEAAAGSERDGYDNHLDGPGCSVRNCAIIDCKLGIEGASMVRDSIFLRTRTALRLSEYHDYIATHVDHVLFEHNLVEGATTDLVGDTAIARAMLRGDPCFRGPLEDLAAPGEPLPPCLQLGDGSAAIGRGQDGGDLGPLPVPRPAASAAPAAAEGTGARVPYWLASPGEPPRGWPKPARVEAGQPTGASWWAVVEPDQAGVLLLRPTLDLAAPAGVLAAWLSAEQAGERTLHVAGDTEDLEVFVDGAPILQERRRTRFGAARPIALPLRAGRNLLLVRVAGWGPSPRLLLAVQGQWSADERPPAAPLRLSSRRALRTRDGVFVEITVDQPAHWAPVPGSALALARPEAAGATPAALDGQWLSSRKVRLGPLPAELHKQTIVLTFPGLRSAAGVAAELEPVQVRVP